MGWSAGRHVDHYGKFRHGLLEKSLTKPPPFWKPPCCESPPDSEPFSLRFACWPSFQGFIQGAPARETRPSRMRGISAPLHQADAGKEVTFRKIPVPIKMKSALPPPPKKPKIPPPPKRGILWTWRFSCRKNAFFQAPIKLAQPFPAPELRAENFTDTRIFLILQESDWSAKKSRFGLDFWTFLGFPGPLERCFSGQFSVVSALLGRGPCVGSTRLQSKCILHECTLSVAILTSWRAHVRAF